MDDDMNAMAANMFGGDESTSSSSDDLLQMNYQPANHPQPALQSGDAQTNKLLTTAMLESLGFDKKYIRRGLKIYEKNYGQNYNADVLTEIIVRLQSKDSRKRQKKELLKMDLDPQLADELMKQFGHKSAKQAKAKAKTKGYHKGDIVIYKDRRTCLILDKMDDHIQLCWPLNKPMHERAIIWVNVDFVKKEKKSYKETKTKKLMAMFGGKNREKKQKKQKHSHSNKNPLSDVYEYAHQEAWKEFFVDKFENDSKKVENDEKKQENKQNSDQNGGNTSGVQMRRINGKNSTEYSNLKYEFVSQTYNRFDLISVYTVKNPIVLQKYNKKRQAILHFSVGNDVQKLNEQKLWCSFRDYNSLQTILTEGFRRKYGEAHYIGNGHLFSTSPELAMSKNGKSVNRHLETDEDGIHYLVYANVIVGESCVGHLNMTAPYRKPNRSYNVMYETAFEAPNDPKYFVTFQDYQAMPLHVFTFRQKSGQKYGNRHYGRSSYKQRHMPRKRNKNVAPMAPGPPSGAQQPPQPPMQGFRFPQMAQMPQNMPQNMQGMGGMGGMMGGMGMGPQFPIGNQNVNNDNQNIQDHRLLLQQLLMDQRRNQVDADANQQPPQLPQQPVLPQRRRPPPRQPRQPQVLPNNNNNDNQHFDSV